MDSELLTCTVHNLHARSEAYDAANRGSREASTLLSYAAEKSKFPLSLITPFSSNYALIHPPSGKNHMSTRTVQGDYERPKSDQLTTSPCDEYFA